MKICDEPVVHWEWNQAPFDEVLDFCLANTKGYAVTTNVETVPDAFREYAEKIADAMHYPVDRWHYWVSTLGGPKQNGYGVQRLQLSDEWMPKFPHCHGWDGLTISLHVQTPEEGGELVVFEDDQWTVRRTIKPTMGLVTLVRDHVWHGVRKVKGDTPRVSIMAGAYPHPSEQGLCTCEVKPSKERAPCP